MNIAISNRLLAATQAETLKTTVAFVVSGSHESAMGFRARALASHLTSFDIRFAYRSPNKILSMFGLFLFLVRTRPVVIYVFDISYSAVLSAGFYRLLFRDHLIIETGDAITELARSMGNRGKLLIWLTRVLENFAFKIADRVVVRGNFHREWLSRRGIDADVIHDGVETRQFAAESDTDLRKKFALDGALTIGLVGSSVWSEKLQMCYGWDLVETVNLLQDQPVKGVMIGDGSGITHLKAMCRKYQIEDRVLFLDRVPYEELPQYLRMVDVCLSTQTNDLVGQVRTTGKLPLYMAAGRFILASNVGEAARVLDSEMIVPYDGVKDEQYPRKLADRIERLIAHPKLLVRGASNVALAEKCFEYSVLAERLSRVITATISKRITE